MHPKHAPVVSAQTTMKEYREEYREKQKESFKAANLSWLREQFVCVLDIIGHPRAVDMKNFTGSEEELRNAIESLYANDGRAFIPTMVYPPNMIDNYGKEYALNSRGIYYSHEYRPELVTIDRKVWVPSFEKVDWEEPSEGDRRRRARIAVEHNIDNGTRRKSEYAWEADAWADVFNQMRNDPCLELDKHDYVSLKPETHSVQLTLTGESTVVNRIPDVTFGLATFSGDTGRSFQADELSRERLEKLLLHRKCGLLCDPKWEKPTSCSHLRYMKQKVGAETAVKRDIKHVKQELATSICLIIWCTKTSHQYQVFALTSFGAYWHLLVGYRRPRQVNEYRGTKGMSENVYMFQRIWSAYIHLWAITEFRTFVTDHLKPWHKFCDDNYLLDWRSIYDVKPELKSMRTCDEDTDLPLPSSALQRALCNRRARESLARELEIHHRRKGKEKSAERAVWHCSKSECSELYTSEGFLDHLRDVHGYPESDLSKIKRCLDSAEAEDFHVTEMPHRERLNGGEREACSTNNKRSLVRQKTLDVDSKELSSECIAGPSKRARKE
ncbi:hypothetical protein B0O99DRAFT_724679 [Bisporella sp. PMI_857]|nr:hypothetical protein B0O99DRAFT_590633 [Bisporella sp. PMI_857]KAH8600601.1 hypothetical protein B0O99DRAFT_724679 [Bisporella sp. PMI_857]